MTPPTRPSVHIRAARPSVSWRGAILAILAAGLGIGCIALLFGLLPDLVRPMPARIVALIVAGLPLLAWYAAFLHGPTAQRLGLLRSTLVGVDLDPAGLELVDRDGSRRRRSWDEIAGLEHRAGHWLLLGPDGQPLDEIPAEMIGLAEAVVARRSDRYALRDQDRTVLARGFGLRRPDEPIEPFRRSGNALLLAIGILLATVAAGLLVVLLER